MKKCRKIQFIIAGIVIGCSMSCTGASVIENGFAWNVSIQGQGTGTFGIGWQSVDWAAETACWIDVSGEYSVVDGMSTTLAATTATVEFIGNWIQAAYGDCVNRDTTRGLGRYFLHGDYDADYGAEDYAITMDRDTTTYLAFCGEILSGGDMYSLERTGVYLYGWVSLEVDENGIPMLTGSAIDLDGGPMIVGGGAWEGGIPEPSGGILFLLGAAVLGLRRRTNRPIVNKAF